jgi:hypothetical protein
MNAEISGKDVDGLILAAPAVWGEDGFNFFYRKPALSLQNAGIYNGNRNITATASIPNEIVSCCYCWWCIRKILCLKADWLRDRAVQPWTQR